MDSNYFSELDLPEKEKKILEAAVTIFADKGFSAATTSEIAKMAGVAEGTIFRYFKTKKDILRSILIQMINAISGKLILAPVEHILLNAENKDLRAVLKELLHDRLNLIDSMFPIARIIFTEALYHEDVREALYQNIIARAMEVAKSFCNQMVAKGMLREDLEYSVLLRSLLGNMAVFVAQTRLFQDKFKFEDMDREFDKIIDVVLYGIAKRNP